MNSREKILLVALVITLLVIANALAYKKFYEPRMKAAQGKAQAAEAALIIAEAEGSQAGDEKTNAEMNFLERAEGEPTTVELAGAALQSLVKREALRRSLISKNTEQILDPLFNTHYNRARVRFRVTGRDRDILQWIYSLHQPAQLQVITKLDIKPKSDEKTRMDCEIEIEKWIVAPPEEENL